MNGHDTGFHDHDLSSGAVAVVEGELVEERLTLGGPPRRRPTVPGPPSVRRIAHPPDAPGGGGPAIPIHAYSPPLWRMGAYDIESGGALRRHSISYAEELRPADSNAA